MPEDGIPQDLQTVEDPQSNEEQETSQEHAEEEIPQQSHSFLPLPQGQQSEQDAIRALINGVDPLDWPSNDGDPINEFRTEGLASMTFPTLFPYGKGDPTKRTRLREVSLTKGFQTPYKVCRTFNQWNLYLAICITSSISILGAKRETTPLVVVASSHLSYAEPKEMKH